MTDACGMLSEVYTGKRLDLAATILFILPIIREFIMWLGNIDANGNTANIALKNNYSLLIFIGGEKEQLMTKPNEHKIYLKNRKGFIKLAIEYGANLIPMYSYGENELYLTSDFLLDFRKYLQHTFKMALTITYNTKKHIENSVKFDQREKIANNYPDWCYLFGYTLLPNPHVSLQIEVNYSLFFF